MKSMKIIEVILQLQVENKFQKNYWCDFHLISSRGLAWTGKKKVNTYTHNNTTGVNKVKCFLKTRLFQGLKFMSSVLEPTNMAGVSWTHTQVTGTRGRRINIKT